AAGEAIREAALLDLFGDEPEDLVEPLFDDVGEEFAGDLPHLAGRAGDLEHLARVDAGAPGGAPGFLGAHRLRVREGESLDDIVRDRRPTPRKRGEVTDLAVEE